jgi:predicted amidohydrolase YtcJ
MTEPSVEHGPTVLVNGTILTMDRSQPIAEWVAIEGSQIAAVGSGAPPTVETVDLDGAVVLPGFHDAHVHPPIGGMAMIQCNLHPLGTPSEYVAAVATYARAHPDEPWVLGGGWAMDDFPAGKAPAALLDAVVPDRPVLLRSSEGHASWANTKALEIAGITAATPDPPDGRIERHGDGSPFGTLQEGAAELVERCAPAATVEDYVRAISSAQSMLLSLGVTSWQDAWVTPPVQAAYLQLDRAGLLDGSVQGALWWDRERNLDQIDELIDRSKDGSSRFRPTSVKLMVDGVCENGTAAMRLPYESGDSRGIQFIPRDVLLAAVPRLMAAGLQPHFHAIGDRAIGDALDAVAAGDPADVARVRPHIAHIQVIDPADVPRFAALGVAGNAQAFWACHDSCMTELTMPRLGERRTAMQYPFRSLLDAGARLAAGSDWSVSSANPFEQIRVAVMRSQPGQDKPFLPSEAITVGEMLAAFTVGSAWVNHAESYSGSIQPGKAADLIVADRNPLTIPPAELHLIEVQATYVAGLRVYRA